MLRVLSLLAGISVAVMIVPVGAAASSARGAAIDLKTPGAEVDQVAYRRCWRRNGVDAAGTANVAPIERPRATNPPTPRRIGRARAAGGGMDRQDRGGRGGRR